MPAKPACAPWGQGFGRGYGARSCVACSRALPSIGSGPRNHNVNDHFTCHPGGRCAAASAKLRLAAQNTRLEKILRMQGEYWRGRAQVVETYRENGVSTINSRQGQYITTTVATMIRRREDISRATRSGWKAGSIPMEMFMGIRSRSSIPMAFRST